MVQPLPAYQRDLPLQTPTQADYAALPEGVREELRMLVKKLLQSCIPAERAGAASDD